MKRIIILLSSLIYLCDLQLNASTFTIGVPQELIDQNSSLMVYMVDDFGQQCVGKCQIDGHEKHRTIVQNDLEITTLQEAENFATVVDLTNSPEILPQDVIVLHFELDNSVRIFRILIVKNSFLEDNPFDVLTLSVAQNNELEKNHHCFIEFENDFDPLSDLVDNVDAYAVSSMQHNSTTRLDQYKLYAQIYMLMQYGRMKRAVRNVSSWFYN